MFGIVVLLGKPSITFASTLFYDPISGPVGNNWSPAGWTQVTGQGKYTLDGASGPTQIFRDFNIKDIVIKFDYSIHAHDTTVIFACRANSDFSDVIQPSLNPDGFSHIDECDGGGNCFRDLPASNAPDVPYVDSLGTHHVELSCLGNAITEKEDGNIIIATNSTANLSTGVRFYISSGSNVVSNFQICDSLGCDTVTSTPTPTPIQLNVPLVKQTSSPWGTQEYDSAHIWSPLFQAIGDWGCALTSAVMTLQYYGITVMPDGSPLNPGTLNTWLKLHPEGYKNGGNVYWPAISDLSRLAKLAFNNTPPLQFDALRFIIPNNQTASQIADDIMHNIPDIIAIPDHFVVGKGIQGNIIYINDPFFSKTSLGNSPIRSIKKFVPSQTDLSYLEFDGDPSLVVAIIDGSNQSVGKSYIEDPLQDDNNPTLLSGAPTRVTYLEQPGNGQYTINVTSSNPSQPFSFQQFVTDMNGNTTVSTFSGTTSNNTASITITVKKITVDAFITDLQNALQFHTLTKDQYSPLFAQAKNIKKEIEKNQIFIAKIHLNIIKVLLNTIWGIPSGTKMLLESDITNLLGSL